MKKHLAHALIALLALALPACGVARLGAPAPMEESVQVFGEAAYDRAAVGGAPVAPAAEPGIGGGGAANATSADRMVVMNANLTIVVPDPVESVREITLLAEGMGGFVVSSYTYQTTFGLEQVVGDQAQIVIRVPAERLTEALDQIKEGATEVRTENISGEDVTAAYTDLESRLRNLEAAEESLREIMASATRTEDVMLVFNQLTQVRGEIEMVRGQMRYYEESARLSSISIDLIPDIAEQPISIAGWHPEGVAKEAIEDLVHSLQSLANALIRFGILWVPLLAIFGVPIWLIVRAVLRRRRGKKPVEPAAE
jgi:hypothetical protein